MTEIDKGFDTISNQGWAEILDEYELDCEVSYPRLLEVATALIEKNNLPYSDDLHNAVLAELWGKARNRLPKGEAK